MKTILQKLAKLLPTFTTGGVFKPEKISHFGCAPGEVFIPLRNIHPKSKWDLRFLGIAKREVARWSKDPEDKVGCVIVSKDRRRWTSGYNGFPAGIADTAKRLQNKKLKNKLTVHAELNAILNSRTDLTGWTLYVTKAPCIECAAAIIQAGIARVVCPPIDMASRWKENCEEAKSLLMEAGVSGSSIMTEKFE